MVGTVIGSVVELTKSCATHGTTTGDRVVVVSYERDPELDRMAATLVVFDAESGDAALALSRAVRMFAAAGGTTDEDDAMLRELTSPAKAVLDKL